ncbi:MAG: neutral zinc metallopeptidase, partial [Fenollaria timonensis]
MKWRGRQGSSNVNDRRGESGGGGMPNFGGFKMGTGGMILLLVLYLVFGRGLIGGPSGPGAGIQNGQGTPITSEREEEYK